MRHPLWAAALALTSLIAGPSPNAGVIRFSTGASCTYQSVTIGAAGNMVAVCADTPTPTPSPTPTPTPTPSPTPTPTPSTCAPFPANGKTQPIFPGGSGNYAFDSFNYTNTGKTPGPPTGATAPANSIQIYPLPITFNNGVVVLHGQVMFGDFVLVNLGGQYEVSIAKCPGDFTTYKQDPPLGTNTYRCGLTYGPNFTIGWASGGATPFFNECPVPAGEQWYLNWRVHGCPTDKGQTCGNIFYIPYT